MWDKMDINQWRQALADADDDYLAGLCNKGTVKRAYKELADVQVEIRQQEDGFEVRTGEETCQICLPLGDSRCSCVSRSICKHIIIAILKLREYVEEQAGDTGTAEGGAADQEGAAAENKSATENKSAGQEGGAAGESVSAGQEGTAGESASAGQDRHVFPEISSFPLDKIKKTMGKRRYQKLVSSVSLNLRPQIEVTSVITVTFPDTGTKVKLLEPLEHASCSCHKKELCSHKAEAILWYQMERGILKPELLLDAAEGDSDLFADLDAVHGLADAVLQLLETALRTGLARTSPDILDSLERMAILCHNQELADFERYSRSLRDSWQSYFNRMASFRAEDLMSRMMMVYRKAQALRETEKGEQVLGLAGRFRSEYRQAGELVLIGIGSRRFLSKTGYEGETCYFLEASTGKWYTYTNARPVFYEQHTRRRPAVYGKTPWELKATLQELTQLRIRLKNARANEKNRLSSSGETQGEILGARNVTRSEIAGCYYTDFQKLFREHIGTEAVSWAPEEEKEYGFDESRHPVMVQAAECGEGVFDEITQTFRMELADGRGVPLSIEVAYSKEEDFTIRYLERILRRIHRDNRSIPCFVGDVYLEDGKMKLYPITFLEPKEIIEDGLSGAEAVGTARAAESAAAGEWTETEAAESISSPEAIEAVRAFSDRITGVLSDLFQSGFLTVHDSTLEELDAAVSRAGQYGMEMLSAMLAELGDGLKRQRHQMNVRNRELFDLYGKLNQYVYLCGKRLEIDQAAARMSGLTNVDRCNV